MDYKFYNPARHIVQLTGPNKEVIRVSGGEYVTLPAYYLKYCPKFLKNLGEDATSLPPTTPKITPSREKPVGMRLKVEKPSGNLTHKTTEKQSVKPMRTVGKIIGKICKKDEEATKSFEKFIEGNNITISNNIGIGILSYNRLSSIKRLLNSIEKFSDLSKLSVFVSDESSDLEVKNYLKQIKWIVLVDNSGRLGVAGNSNRLLRCLSRFKYKLLLNDDVVVASRGWESFYFEQMKATGFHHFCFRQPGIYGATANHSVSAVNNIRIKTVYDKPHGAIMALDDVAFNKVGYFDTRFGLYGMEHVDWSYRLSRSEIQPAGYHDVDGSYAYFRINDDQSAVEDRAACLSESKKLFESIKNTRIFVEPDVKSSVPSVSYIIPYREQEGRRNVISLVIDNIRSQLFPNIEIILVEHDSSSKTKYWTLDPCKCLLVSSNTAFNKSEAFNSGVCASTYDIIVLHDADMMVPRDYTSQVYGILNSFDSCHIGKNVLYLNQSSTDCVFENKIVDRNSQCNRIVGYFEGGSLACHKNSYINIGGFNEDFVGYGCEDCEFFERLKYNTNMYDERYIDFVHLEHGRSSGWSDLHNKNKEIFNKLKTMPMNDRITILRSRFVI